MSNTDELKQYSAGYVSPIEGVVITQTLYTKAIIEWHIKRTNLENSLITKTRERASESLSHAYGDSNRPRRYFFPIFNLTCDVVESNNTFSYLLIRRIQGLILIQSLLLLLSLDDTRKDNERDTSHSFDSKM